MNKEKKEKKYEFAGKTVSVMSGSECSVLFYKANSYFFGVKQNGISAEFFQVF